MTIHRSGVGICEEGQGQFYPRIGLSGGHLTYLDLCCKGS